MIQSKISGYLSLYLIFYFVLVPPLFAQVGFGQALGERRLMVKDADEKNTVQSFGSMPSQELKNGQDTLSETSIPVGGPGSGVSQSISYTVHILGEVNRPGVYKIVPSDRLSEAVKYAGGILSDGSSRGVQLRRGNQTTVFDLLRYKQNGDLTQNPFLMDNDVVFVPLKKGEVDIEGPVKRPGIYELIGKTNLAQALALAGGFSTGLSHQQPIRIIRYNMQEKKQVIPVENSPESLKNFIVLKGDVIVVPHILITDKEFDYDINRLPGDNIFYPSNDDNVYVIGAVSLPGPYAFQPHYTYKQYVNQAGPLKDAKMRHVKIVRPNGKKVVAFNKVIINPGDTILIPQRYWKAETVVGWLATLSSLFLTGFLVYDTANSR